MDANEFLVKIKANGTSKDWDDLANVYLEYKNVLVKLSAKDKGSFSLNVLCLLCRNLDRVPSWKDAVNPKDLLTLSIDCIRETRGLNKADQVKTLACIYHVHKHVVRKNSQAPPELILKLSFMAFETDAKNLLKEYCKTYWNILADRLTYIEKLKGKSLQKLLPKLTEDILNTIEIYDTVQFCANGLVFLVKKLHSIYNDSNSEQLNVLYGEIFKKLSSKNDTNTIKKLNEEATLDLYIKMCDCLYVVAENASKTQFKRSSLNIAVRGAISLLGHQPDMFHCLQTFYLNSFCDLFENKTTYADAVFKNLTVSCEITEKLGYRKTMLATYAYLNQFLRLYVEYSVNNSIKENFSVDIQENCLNFMLKVLSMLKYSQQLLKCENCNVKSPLHDALRLSFLLKHFITISMQYNIDITSLTTIYNKLIDTQYSIMNELKRLKCANIKKFYLKLQTDTHNTAILLNRHQKYEFSITLFEIYIRNELTEGSKTEIEYKNVSRAFYNKSICELDYKKYDIALLDAYLSLIFSEDLNLEKHMSLVMDIKAKSLKDDKFDDDGEQNYLQLLSVVDACSSVLKKGFYGHIELYFKDVKFSRLLRHEFSMYSKLWPSIMPIAGVWKSLYQLVDGQQEKWMAVEDEETVLWTLLEVISLTPSAVRSINNDQFKEIILKLLERIDKIPDPVPVDIRVVQTTLLFLKTEYDIADASLKYGWKITDVSTDPEQVQLTRTLKQEHEAIQSALQAVEIWTEVVTEVNTVTKTTCLRHALILAEIFVQHLLFFSRVAHGLQLAHICCQVAQYTGQTEAYIRNAGVLAYHISAQDVLQDIITLASEYWGEIVIKESSLETALVFLSDVAIYYNNSGCVGVAAKLVQLAQAKILKAYETYPDVNLDLAVGRLMEAQAMMCKNSGLSTLTDVNGIQRHYLSISNNALAWSTRRLVTARSRCSSCLLTQRCARACGALGQVRRARAAAAAAPHALGAAALATCARATIDTHALHQAQVTIDNRLKYILGLSNEPPTSVTESKVELFAPKQDLEVMLESQHIKSLSPTRKYVQIPGFKIPEFLGHTNCDCYACDNIFCTIISYVIGGLEASMYFRANEVEIAKNYYQGIIHSFKYFDSKMEYVMNKYIEMDFKEYIINHVRKLFEDEFKKVKLEILIESTYFELKNENFDKADDYLVTVHEITQDISNPDAYMSNEIMNLMIASARVRNVVKKQETDLETEFENLRLSPKGDVPKTPISKPILPVQSSKKVMVGHEEIPKKRKVIKLNLDEGSSDERDQEKPKTRKPVFKIPVPVTSKAVLENITPRVTRKPAITVTDTSKTPKTGPEDKLPEFFTPMSTPEQFFTPLNTIKTYSKTNLRRGIVKNLEEEFSTPSGKGVKTEMLEIPTRSARKVEKDRVLRRATSPGKLTETQTRPRRLRQPRLNNND
ncbi:unnamed protein product [Arctia plantaginis]|uniref:Uncharacterized protein n=1 Tax=Arctia plantaginis TaxID=874455 RepID=A0A8S0YX62_ARCPL|nr:unnamed protein product [Arctia plantaginis]